jgi:hypothetical protein
MIELLEKLRRRAAAFSRNKDKARITIRLGDVREGIAHIEAMEAVLRDAHKLLDQLPLKGVAPVLKKINAILTPAPTAEAMPRTDLKASMAESPLSSSGVRE